MVARFQRRERGSQLAEFGPAMWIFFIIILIPLVDLMSFVAGVGTVLAVAELTARKSASARTFTEAINVMNQTEDDLAGFRGFAKMVASGAGPRGVTIQVMSNSTSAAAGAPTIFAPPPVANRIPTDRATLDTTIYHYQVTAAYDVQPLFNFSGFPLLGAIPGLGTPVPVTYVSSAVVEHPDGLND